MPEYIEQSITSDGSILEEKKYNSIQELYAGDPSLDPSISKHRDEILLDILAFPDENKVLFRIAGQCYTFGYRVLSEEEATELSRKIDKELRCFINQPNTIMVQHQIKEIVYALLSEVYPIQESPVFVKINNQKYYNQN